MARFPASGFGDVVRVGAVDLDPDVATVGFDHPYFETAWLPAIGPTSWLVWRTLGMQIAEQGEIEVAADHLARRHGVFVPALHRSLGRLRRFRVLRHIDGGLALPAACIPLSARLLDEASPAAKRLHNETFPTGSGLTTAPQPPRSHPR